MNTLEALKFGRERIARGWTRGALARDVDGGKIADDSKDAVCWCTLGALPKFYWEEAERELTATVSDYSLGHWNDAPERTQADVLKAYDDTIARLEAQPQPRAPLAEGEAQ